MAKDSVRMGDRLHNRLVPGDERKRAALAFPAYERPKPLKETASGTAYQISAGGRLKVVQAEYAVGPAFATAADALRQARWEASDRCAGILAELDIEIAKAEAGQ